MNTLQRIAKNTGSLLLGDAISSFLGILLVVFLARYFGAAEYGKYAFALAFTQIFAFVTDMGLSALSIREIAREKKKAGEYLTAISLTKLALSIIMFGVIILTVNLFQFQRDTITIIYIFSAVNVLSSFSVFLRSIFRAFEKMEYDAITRIIERFLVVGIALIVLLQGGGLLTVVLTMLLGQAVGLLVTFIVCVKRFTKPALLLNVNLAGRLLMTAIPFAISSVFANMMYQTDTVMLSLMKDEATVGWYSAAYRPIAGILFLPGVLIGSIFPVLSRFHVTSKDSLVFIYQKSLKYLIAIAIPLCIGTILIAGRIIAFLYGEAFVNSVIVLQILSASVSLVFIVMLLGHTLASIDKQIVDMKIVGICTLVNVILNLSLIPTFSYIGAAIASLASQAILCFIEFFLLQKYLHRINLVKIIYKPLFAAMLMGAIVFSLDRTLESTPVNLFFIIIVGMVSYGLLLYLFKTFDTQEIETIKGIFKRNTPKMPE